MLPGPELRALPARVCVAQLLPAEAAVRRTVYLHRCGGSQRKMVLRGWCSKGRTCCATAQSPKLQGLGQERQRQDYQAVLAAERGYSTRYVGWPWAVGFLVTVRVAAAPRCVRSLLGMA